jgi:hypothetical protein
MSSRDELIRHYATLPDDRLMTLAANEAAQLTPEALAVLREEVHRRGLDKDLRDAISIQTRRVEPAELEELVQRFRRLPCPICGSRSGLLNAAKVATAHSVLVMTTYEAPLIVGCAQCIVAAASRANRTTAMFAWWGIPWGPIRGLEAMSVNAKAKSLAEMADATDELRGYVAANLGEVMLLLRKESGVH